MGQVLHVPGPTTLSLSLRGMYLHTSKVPRAWVHRSLVDPGHTETLVHQTLVRLGRSWRQSGWRLVVCMGVVHERKNHSNYKLLGSKGMPSLKWNRPENSVGTGFSTQQWYDVHFGVHRCKNFPALKHASLELLHKDFLALHESEEFSQQQVETPVAENVALRVGEILHWMNDLALRRKLLCFRPAAWGTTFCFQASQRHFIHIHLKLIMWFKQSAFIMPIFGRVKEVMDADPKQFWIF